MATPSTPVSPFLKAGTAKKTTSSVSPFLRDNKKVAADNSPLGAILNFGQSAINTISTPMYAVQGTLNEIVNQSKAGNDNPADALWKSIQAGNKNATSWTRGEKTIMGQDLLKNMGILDKKESGGDFWAGLAADILLDPITYVPFGVIATAIKAPLVAGRGAIKAGKLAATGQLSESVARRAATSAGSKAIVGAAQAGEGIAFKPLKRKLTSGYTPERIDLARATAKAAEQYKVPLTKLEKTQIKAAETVAKTSPDLLAYKTIQLGGTPLNTVNNRVASSIEAARSAMVATILTDSAKRSLAKAGRKEAKFIRQGIATSIPFQATINTARQVESASVKAGESAIAMEDGTVATVKPNTRFQDGDAVHVWDGKNVRTWDKGDAAANDAAAKAYLENLTTPVTKPIVIEGRPLIDSAPMSNIMKQLVNIKKPSAEIKTINTMLKNLDNIAKNAKGVAIAGDNVAYKIKQIIDSVDPKKAAFFSGLRSDVKNLIDIALKGERGNVFGLIARAADGTDKQLLSVAKEILDQVILIDGVKRTVREAYNSGLNWSDLKPDTRTAINRAVKVLTQDSTDAKLVASSKLSEIESITSPEIAAQIAKTGALDPNAKVLQRGALNKILEGIKASPKASSKTYANFDEFMAGLKGEDQFDTEVLEKILNAMDPDNAAIKKVDNIADADLNIKLANILNDKGMQLVSDARRRLEILDAAKILKARGLGLHEAVASYISLRIAGEMPPAGNAALESRQEAIDRILRLYDSPDGNSLAQRILTSVGTGNDKRMSDAFKIMQADGATTFVSSLGDASMRSTTKTFQANTEAMNYLQLNQSYAVGSTASVLALMRVDAGRKALAAAKRLDPNFVPEDQIVKFVKSMDILESATLAIYGSRMSVVKSAKGASFRPENKHYVYLHTGDIADVVSRTGKPELVMRSLFPNTKTASDSFSYIGMNDAVRMIMEGREAGAMPSRGEIIKRLLSRGDGQAAWSPEFAATTKQTAEELADHLLDPAVIKNFEDIHTTRAIAEVEDNLGEVITLTQDVIQTMLDGYRASKLSGKLSDAERRNLMREAFAKFTFAAGFMGDKTGDQAKSMMEIAAITFLKDGRLAKINGLDEIIDGKVLPEDQGQLDQILGSFDTMYQYQNPYAVPMPGRENIKLPTAAAKAKAAENLTGKEIAFETLMRSWSDVKTPEASKKWAADYKRISAQLDKARDTAWKNHLPTRHYDNGKWVPTEKYNHAKATQKATQAADRIALVGDKQVDRIDGMTDSKPIDMGVKLTVAQSKKIVANYNEKAALRAQELSDAAAQDAAQHALDVSARIDAEALDPYEAALRLEHERIAFRYSQIEEVVDIPESSTYRYSPTYEGVKYAVQSGYENVSKFKTALGRFNAGANPEAVSILRGAESRGFNAKNKISTVTRTLADDLTKVNLTQFIADGEKFANPIAQQRIMRSRAFSTSFNLALKGAEVPAQYGPEFKVITEKLGRLIVAAQDQINGLNMPPEVIDRYFTKYGVTGYEGFQAASKYKNPEAFKDFLNDLPFNENPHEVGTDAHTLFAQRKAAFEASDSDAFVMFSNIVFSLVDAKTEQAFVLDFVSQFGYKAEGITLKQAIDRGYKKVAAIPGSVYDLSVHLTGKTDALFDPALAKEFANLNREWSYMQGKGVSPVLRYMMDLTGILKATQTILRPGHVMTNVVGDATTAMIGGARHPKHWTGGLRMAKAFMQNRVGAEGFLYSKGDTEKQITSAISQLARFDKNPEAALKEASKGGYTVVINGQKQTLPDEFWVSIGEDTGTATDNMVTNDIQGLYESAQARGIENGARGEIAKTQYAKIKDGFDRAIKPAGDVTAYYSNISRFASMLNIVDGKNWSSIEEMKRAITDHVALYHPTITSLAATERRYPRAIFTYYTWLRVAHNVLIDMAMNHTAAITLYPKAQANLAAAAGYDPNSLGDAWGTNKQTTPSYMSYSVYAPMGEEGPRGPVLFKPSILPLDVLDTWAWTYDPYKNFEENNIKNISTTIRKVAGMTNVVAQPLIEAATGTDLLTGSPKNIKNLQGVSDEIISNFGYGTILKGIGAWTPQNKLPENTSNPITDRDRELYRENWTFGLKRQDLNTVSNQRNSQSEQTARLKQFMEWYTKQQETNK